MEFESWRGRDADDVQRFLRCRGRYAHDARGFVGAVGPF